MPGNVSTKSSGGLNVQHKFGSQYPSARGDHSPNVPKPPQQPTLSGHASMTSTQITSGHQAHLSARNVPQHERNKLGMHLNISNSMSPRAYAAGNGVYAPNQTNGHQPNTTKNSNSLQLANQFYQQHHATGGPTSPTNYASNPMTLTSPYSHGLAQKQ